MNWQWLATWGCILIAVVIVLRRIPGLRNSGNSASAGCGGCGGCSTPDSKAIAVPLVQLGTGSSPLHSSNSSTQVTARG
jgi:hypothetical protein